MLFFTVAILVMIILVPSIMIKERIQIRKAERQAQLLRSMNDHPAGKGL